MRERKNVEKVGKKEDMKNNDKKKNAKKDEKKTEDEEERYNKEMIIKTVDEMKTV